MQQKTQNKSKDKVLKYLQICAGILLALSFVLLFTSQTFELLILAFTSILYSIVLLLLSTYIRFDYHSQKYEVER